MIDLHAHYPMHLVEPLPRDRLLRLMRTTTGRRRLGATAAGVLLQIASPVANYRSLCSGPRVTVRSMRADGVEVALSVAYQFLTRCSRCTARRPAGLPRRSRGAAGVRGAPPSRPALRPGGSRSCTRSRGAFTCPRTFRWPTRWNGWLDAGWPTSRSHTSSTMAWPPTRLAPRSSRTGSVGPQRNVMRPGRALSPSGACNASLSAAGEVRRS